MEIEDSSRPTIPIQGVNGGTGLRFLNSCCGLHSQFHPLVLLFVPHYPGSSSTWERASNCDAAAPPRQTHGEP